MNFRNQEIVNGVLSYTSENGGVWYFPAAPVRVVNNEIVIGDKDFQNYVRFVDLEEADKLGKENAIDLVKEWAILGYLGAGPSTGGSISVTNFPSIQPVSGTVGVNNFPAIQPVSGTVEVNNLPATQPPAYASDFQGAAISERRLTQIDLKQTKDNLPLFFSRINNGLATQTHSVSEANTAMSVSANNDYAIVQSFQRFQYQNGKTKYFIFTFEALQPQANVAKRVGCFNGGIVAPYTTFDGAFLESSEGTVYACIYRNGTEVLKKPQIEWLDKLDGTGTSGITVDWTKSQVFLIEYLWLGFGGVTFSLLIEGQKIELYKYRSANIDAKIFMQSPNQPIRYEIRSSGGSGTLYQVCSTAGTYGGSEDLGTVKGIFSGTTAQAFAVANTKYLCLAIRLKSTHLDAFIEFLDYAVLSTSNDNFLYDVVLNPTIAGAVTWVAQTNSALEVASGLPANTVSGGLVLQNSLGVQSTVVKDALKNALRLGSSISGIADVIALCFTPLSAGATGFSTINVREAL